MVRLTGRPLGSCFGDACSNPQCPISPLFLFELKHGIPCIKQITSYNKLRTMCSVMERWCPLLTRGPGFEPPLRPFFLFLLKHGIPCIKNITSYHELQTMCSVMERWCSFLTRRPGFEPRCALFFKTILII